MKTESPASILIVTVSKNDVLGLRKTLTSILSQNYAKWSCAIVVGQSSDGTEKVAEEFSELDDRFSWQLERGSGIFAAMNEGMLKVDSEFLMFLNSSDEFYDDKSLRTLYESIIPSTYTMVIGSFIVKGEKKPRFLPIHAQFSQTDFAFGRKWGNHQSILFRRSSAPIEYDMEFKISSDFKFILNCLEFGPGLRIPNIVARIEPGGISDIKLVPGLLEKYRIRIEVLDFFPGRILNLLWTFGAILKNISRKFIN